MGGTHARGATVIEYAVLFFVLLVLALVVSGLMGLNSQTKNMQAASRVYWGTTATPLKITDWSMRTYKQDDPLRVEANLTLEILNPTREAITVTGITLEPGKYDNIYDMHNNWIGASSGMALRLEPGTKQAVVVQHWQQGASAFVPRAIYTIYLNFSHDASLGSHSVLQQGNVPLIGENDYVNAELADGNCPPGMVDCNGICVPVNRCCGGSTCLPPNAGCNDAGVCCPAGSQACGSTCCTGGEHCEAGVCTVGACDAPDISCGTWCCERGGKCLNESAATYGGACAGSCPGGTTICGDSWCCLDGAEECTNPAAGSRTVACQVACTAPSTRCSNPSGNASTCCADTGDIVCANSTPTCCDTSVNLSCTFTNSSGTFGACCNPNLQACDSSDGCCQRPGSSCTQDSDCCDGWNCNGGVCNECPSGWGAGCCAQPTLLCNFNISASGDPIALRDWNSGIYQDCCQHSYDANGNYINEVCSGNYYDTVTLTWSGCPLNTIPGDADCANGPYEWNTSQWRRAGEQDWNYASLPAPGTFPADTAGCCVNTTDYCNPSEGIYCCPGMNCNNGICALPFQCPSGYTFVDNGDAQEDINDCCLDADLCWTTGNTAQCCGSSSGGTKKYFWDSQTGARLCRCCGSGTDTLCGEDFACCPAGQCNEEQGTCCSDGSTRCQLRAYAYECCNDTLSDCVANNAGWSGGTYDQCCPKSAVPGSQQETCTDGACCDTATGTYACTDSGCCDLSNDRQVCSLNASTCCGPSAIFTCVGNATGGGSQTQCCPQPEKAAYCDGPGYPCCETGADCVGDAGGQKCCDDKTNPAPALCAGNCCEQDYCIALDPVEKCCDGLAGVDPATIMLCGPDKQCCPQDNCKGAPGDENCCASADDIVCDDGKGDCCADAAYCVGPGNPNPSHCCPPGPPDYVDWCTGSRDCCSEECEQVAGAGPAALNYCCEGADVPVKQTSSSDVKCCPAGSEYCDDGQCCPGGCDQYDLGGGEMTPSICCTPPMHAVFNQSSANSMACCAEGQTEICASDGKCCSACTADGYCCDGIVTPPENGNYCNGDGETCCVDQCTLGPDGAGYCCSPQATQYCPLDSQPLACCSESCTDGHCCSGTPNDPARDYCGTDGCCPHPCNSINYGGGAQVPTSPGQEFCCPLATDVVCGGDGECCASDLCEYNNNNQQMTCCPDIVRPDGQCCSFYSPPQYPNDAGGQCCPLAGAEYCNAQEPCCMNGCEMVNGEKMCGCDPGTYRIATEACCPHATDITCGETLCCDSGGTQQCIGTTCCAAEEVLQEEYDEYEVLIHPDLCCTNPEMGTCEIDGVTATPCCLPTPGYSCFTITACNGECCAEPDVCRKQTVPESCGPPWEYDPSNPCKDNPNGKIIYCPDGGMTGGHNYCCPDLPGFTCDMAGNPPCDQI